MMNLSEHFTLREAIKSDAATRLGIDNSPDTADIYTLLQTAAKMEEVRALLNAPIIVTSWYRNEKVNKAVGGVPSSQHRKGEAVDFIAPRFGSPRDICLKIQNSDIQFDQLILEPSWVHISFKHQGRVPRKQVLTLTGPGRYEQGIV